MPTHAASSPLSVTPVRQAERTGRTGTGEGEAIKVSGPVGMVQGWACRPRWRVAVREKKN